MQVKITDDKMSMEDLLKDSPDVQNLELGSLVTGKVVSKGRNSIVVDLGGFVTGIISGRETRDSSGTIFNLQPNDEVSAVLVEDENEEGMYVLSLRKASQERAWNRFVKAYNEQEMIEVVAQEVNKGGLLLEIDGIKGFIPVSQLAPLNYPRVDGGDSNEIVRRLQKLIGQKFLVKIINIDEDNGKLILSEKEAMSGQRSTALNKLKPNQKVKGKISGIVKFGIFVTFDGLEGLVHISEIAWGHVSNPNEFGKLGDEVEVMVIGVEGEKISLSMKRLQEDPWQKAAKNYEVGTKVKGIINRVTPFGAFMKLENDINGLIHLSEISHDKVTDPTEFVHIGDEVEAVVINIDPKEHRIGLSLKALHEAPAEAKAEEAPAEKAEVKEEEKAEEPKEEVAEAKEEEKAEKQEEKAETKEEKAEKKATKKKATTKAKKDEEKEKKPKKKAATKKKTTTKAKKDEEKEEKPKKKAAAKKKTTTKAKKEEDKK